MRVAPNTVTIYCDLALALTLGALPCDEHELREINRAGIGHRYFRIVPKDGPPITLKWAVVHPGDGLLFAEP